MYLCEAIPRRRQSPKTIFSIKVTVKVIYFHIILKGIINGKAR